MKKSVVMLVLTSLLSPELPAAEISKASGPADPQVTVERLQDSPLLSPQPSGAGSAGIFNPAAVRDHGKVILLYREQDAHGTSRIGYAASPDGIHFTARPQPVLSPQADYERDGGVEDPRLVKFGQTYYMTYTGYNKKDAQLCLATSRDLVHWQRKGVILPAYKGKWNRGWTKSGAIVPQKINGQYWMYYLGTGADKTDEMGLAHSTDLLHWVDDLDLPVLSKRPGNFDEQVVEPGPAPIITSAGIFMIYNGADKKLVYRTGWVLFDKNDPGKVLARSGEPIFAPQLDWETIGQVPNVIFVEGMVPAAEKDSWLLYYGGADKYIGGLRARFTFGGPH